MIEFFKKNQKNVTMGAAITLLLICYFQQKELARLRKEVAQAKEIKVDGVTQDSLLNKLNLK
jgi:mannose/fructose-specific phosphotransferase system component IIA